jgi:hypothetical protein
MLIGSLVIAMGVDTLEYGWAFGLSSWSKWVGGALIFVIIALLTVPIGIGIRYVLGRIGQRNLPAAVVTGAVIGLALIPVLHPAMYRDLSMATNPIGLLLVHALAGCIGGLTWFGTELLQTPRARAA